MKIINIQNIKYVESFDKDYDDRYTYNEQEDTFNFKGCGANINHERFVFEKNFYLIEENNKIYTKPYLKITYIDKDFDKVYFNTLEEVENYAKHTLCNYTTFKEIKQ